MVTPKKKKGGWVYVAESTRKDGSKKLYTGKTSKKPSTRWNQHKSEVKKTNSKTWTGKGTSFKPLGAIWSSNPTKAEKTIKSYSPEKKRGMAKAGNIQKKKKGWFW